MTIRTVFVLGMLAAGAGCSTFVPVQDREDVPLAPAECAADQYAFAGRGTLRSLGLVGQSRAPLPEPDRPAMIWVTADLLPFDAGERGGEREMTRMLCFEFDDGSGGAEWPVDEAWQPPRELEETDQEVPTVALVLLAVVGLVVVGASAFAFRHR